VALVNLSLATVSVLVCACHRPAASDRRDPTTAASSRTVPTSLPTLLEPQRPALEADKHAVRVALVGDQGIGKRARAVLDLVHAESADLLVVLGDFDYENKPGDWGQMLERLGHDFPWFAVVGNHDVAAWPAYERLITAKQQRVAGARCHGKPGRQASCLYRGVQLVMSEIGTMGERGDNEAFIRRELAESHAPYKLCLWHKTQHDMQTGAKSDEVGWTAYRACQDAGAIVVTGHEHAYARTRTLTALGDAAAGHGATGAFNELFVGLGRTFVAVAGLGGIQTRVFVPSHSKDTWWGSYLTLDRECANGQPRPANNAADGFGALFLDLGVGGDETLGRGRFVTATTRRVVDDFTIHFVGR
jgi:hypothetical protein